MGEVRFECVADTQKISGNGLRFNVGRHKDHKKTKGVGGRIDGEVMDFAERKIRLEMRIVSVESRKLNWVAECDSVFTQEFFLRPGTAWRLPVSSNCVNQRRAAPITF